MTVKLAYKNLIENKTRSFAIAIIIALAVVMVFMSLIYARIIEDEYSSSVSVTAENADISIIYDAKSQTRIITTQPLNNFNNDIDFAIGILDLYGVAYVNNKINYINLRGISEEGFYKLNNVKVLEKLPRDLKKDELIISKKTSEELNLPLNSKIYLEIGGKEKPFYIGTILEDHPCFEQLGAYVMYGVNNYVTEYINLPFGNVYNKIFIKTKDNIDKNNLLISLAQIQEYEGYKIGLVEDDFYLDHLAEEISLPITIGVMACAFLALFMVYSIINGGLKKRIGYIAQLKSIGATTGYVFKILFIEHLIIIIAGSLTGILISSLFLNLAVSSLMNINSQDNFYTNMLIISLIITCTLTLILMVFPLLKTQSISTRKAYTESKNTLWKGRLPLFISGSILLIISFVLVWGNSYLNAPKGIISVVLYFISLIIILPFVVKYFSLLIQKFIAGRNGTTFIALKNLVAERSVMANARIMITGILVCIIVLSAAQLTSSLGKQVINDLDCDIIIRNARADTDADFNRIKNFEGIYDVYAFQHAKVNIDFKGKTYRINIIGVNPDELELIGTIEYVTPYEEFNYLLNEKDGLLVDYMYHKVYKVNIGDELAVEINDITHNLTVEGFYHSYQYGGRSALINKSVMNELYGLSQYDTIICKTEGEIDSKVNALRAELGVHSIVVLNKHSYFKVYIDIINNTVVFAYFFAFFILLISFISVFINIQNSREERKFTLYRMYSLGISRRMQTLIDFQEKLISGIVVFVVTLLTYFIINRALTNALSLSSILIINPINIKMIIVINFLFNIIHLFLSLSNYFFIKDKSLMKILKQD